MVTNIITTNTGDMKNTSSAVVKTMNILRTGYHYRVTKILNSLHMEKYHSQKHPMSHQGLVIIPASAC